MWGTAHTTWPGQSWASGAGAAGEEGVRAGEQEPVSRGWTLTLALVGAVGGGRLPRPLVEAGAAAVAGAPTRVVLTGALQPVGTRDRRGHTVDLGAQGPHPAFTERSRRDWMCWRVGTGTGTEWSVRAGPTCRAPGQVLQDRANPSLPRPGPQAEPTASLGRGGGPGLPQQYELSQTPPCFQGASPGAKGQERLPLPAGVDTRQRLESCQPF